MLRRALPVLALLIAPPSFAATPRAMTARGILGPPSAIGAEEAVARSALAAHLPWTRSFALTFERVDPRDDGSRVVRFGQSIDGIPVAARGARVFLRADGAPVLAAARLEERTTTATRKFEAPAAAAIAARGARFRFDAAHASLVYVSTPGAPRLAWSLPAIVPSELPTRPFAIVDATRGTVLYRGDSARSAKQVRVFPDNPAVSMLGVKSIASLPDGSKTLTTPAWTARTCVDRGRVVDVDLGSRVPMHVCTFEQTAVADAAGDFLYSRPAADTALDDTFAETSAAYHVDRALLAFATMGLTTLRARSRPLTVTANMRMPPSWELGPIDQLACKACALDRLDNAFFVPFSGGLSRSLFGSETDALFLGQGEKLDYAYDGDVVYHELGHAVVQSTADLVNFTHLDEQGAIDVSGALNEGIADYLSAAITNDPRIGEYVSGGEAIRDLSIARSCPEWLTNESHHDSLIFSGALFSARSPSDRAKFDRGVMLGLQMAPAGDMSFEEMAEVMIESVITEAGPSAGKLLRNAFSERGLMPCRRIRELPEGGRSSFDPGYLSTGASSIDAELAGGIVPGALQFHQKVPAGTTRIVVRFEGKGLPPSPQWIGGDPWLPVVLAKFGGPIVFNDGASGFRGNHDATRELPEDGPFEATFEVTTGTTDVYVMIGARGDGGGLYNEVSVQAFSDVVKPDAGPSDAAPIADTATEAGEVPLDDDTLNGRACTCDTKGPRRAPSLALALVALGALALRIQTRRNAR